jgi:hypothetical protein
MGIETAIALGLGSTYLGARNQAHAARKQDKQTAIGIDQQAARQKEAMARVNDTVQRTANSNPAGEQRQNYGEFMDALRRNAGANTGAVGRTSDAYQTGTQAADKQTGDTSSKLAGLFSRIDAQGDQRRGEAFDAARAGTDVGLIQDKAKGEDFVNTMRVKSIHANPWIDLLSKFGTLAAGGMAAAAAPAAGASALGGGSAGALNAGKGAVDFSTVARNAAAFAV